MRVLTFYLPQFHPIPENDAWWGKGFTEWTNVAKARPRFRGHLQPQIPADLGFYDLRLPETRAAQARLAREHGIDGFCYYHYWFNGRQLLERPFEEVFSSGQPDFPFCLCWANENWTRRWDGQERQVLMAQDYRSYDPVAHIRWLEERFRDPRYIRIEGRPLFLLYRPDLIPELSSVIDQWRSYVNGRGYAGLYFCAVNSAANESSLHELFQAGCDAVIDFQPNLRNVRYYNASRAARALVPKLFHKLANRVDIDSVLELKTVEKYEYRAIVEAKLSVPLLGQKPVFPCVFPSWDNSSRRSLQATVIQNEDAGLYGRWLQGALQVAATFRPAEQFVFINAWNEWAEGCHLEPDLHNGRRFLEKTREVIEQTERDSARRAHSLPAAETPVRS